VQETYPPVPEAGGKESCVSSSPAPIVEMGGSSRGMGEASSRVFKVGDEVFGLAYGAIYLSSQASFPLFIIAYPFIKKPTRLTHAPWHRRNTPTSSPFPQTRTF
jgi:hypothetical protein